MISLKSLQKGNFSLLDASLYVAKGAARDGLNEDFNIEEYRGIIKEYVDELKKRIANKKDPEEIISEINGFLFKEEGFKYFSSRVPALIFLNKVLDGKEGNCLGLSTLYLVLAEALNLPIDPLLLPRHMALMWDDGKFKRYIEPTNGGNSSKLEERIKKYDAIANGVGEYVKKGSKKLVIACLLKSRASMYIEWNKYLDEHLAFRGLNGEIISHHLRWGEYLHKALKDLKKVLAIDPHIIEAYITRAEIYILQGRPEEAISDLNKALELDPVHLFPEIYYWFGEAYTKKGQDDIAKKYFEQYKERYESLKKIFE